MHPKNSWINRFELFHTPTALEEILGRPGVEGIIIPCPVILTRRRRATMRIARGQARSKNTEDKNGATIEAAAL